VSAVIAVIGKAKSAINPGVERCNPGVAPGLTAFNPGVDSALNRVSPLHSGLTHFRKKRDASGDRYWFHSAEEEEKERRVTVNQADKRSSLWKTFPGF
jgi:hypothetical protein